jgi:late competence protein required for DNA uptake (superfamily II DNA/RNA helicase)
VIFKILPLLAPIIIFILLKLIKSYITSTLFAKKQSQSNEMIVCDRCGTYVHEDLLLKKFGKFYCSKDCFSQ